VGFFPESTWGVSRKKQSTQGIRGGKGGHGKKKKKARKKFGDEKKRKKDDPRGRRKNPQKQLWGTGNETNRTLPCPINEIKGKGPIMGGKWDKARKKKEGLWRKQNRLQNGGSGEKRGGTNVTRGLWAMKQKKQHKEPPRKANRLVLLGGPG